MNKIYDFAWGDPVCVRETLNSLFPILITTRPSQLTYSNDTGDIETVNLLKEYVKHTTGIEYKHLIIVPGATFGINVTLRVMKEMLGYDSVHIDRDGFYYYPNMIEQAELTPVYQYQDNSISLCDSPSNPLGQYKEGKSYLSTIWDSVYHSKVYINTPIAIPEHLINVGSVTKGLGLAGLRIGYIAFNNDLLLESITRYVKFQLCTVSLLGQQYLNTVLKGLDFTQFTTKANKAINDNKDQFSRLHHLFGRSIPSNGMFYVGDLDNSLEKLLDKVNVKCVKLPSGGARFNCAQNIELTKEMVDSIIKTDRIK